MCEYDIIISLSIFPFILFFLFWIFYGTGDHQTCLEQNYLVDHITPVQLFVLEQELSHFISHDFSAG